MIHDIKMLQCFIDHNILVCRPAEVSIGCRLYERYQDCPECVKYKIIYQNWKSIFKIIIVSIYEV